MTKHDTKIFDDRAASVLVDNISAALSAGLPGDVHNIVGNQKATDVAEIPETPESIVGVNTRHSLTPATRSGARKRRGDVHNACEKQTEHDIAEIPEMRGSDNLVNTIATVTPATKSGARKRRGDAQPRSENHLSHGAAEIPELQEPAVNSLVATSSVPALASDQDPMVNALVGLQKIRKFAIKSQSRCDRSVDSYTASMLGYTNDLTPAKRKATFAQAAALRKAVEEGKPTPSSVPPEIQAVCEPMILASLTSRKTWDDIRAVTETQMRETARSLPVWPLVRGISGFAELGLAILVGETGNLSNYATKERVWKRLGLAVIGGERQRRVAGAEAAALHGFNPGRRAAIWAQADSMFRHQWAGDKDANGKDPVKTKQPVAVPAHPKGPYGEVYLARKTATEGREGWCDARRENDARRIMTKALVADIWREWHRLVPV